VGRLEGKVALITGAARGQGRAHAVRMATEGADVVLVDACRRVGPTGYPPATPEDLAETEAMVRKSGRDVVARQCDVRDGDGLRQIVDDAVARLGRLDVVVANAGISFFRPFLEMSDADWDDMISVNLTGVQRTLRAALPAMVAARHGGSVVLIGSVASVKVVPYESHYVAAKHALVGLMRALAVELAAHGIRVNGVGPGGVETAMGQDPGIGELLADPTRASVFAASYNPLLASPTSTPDEIAEAVVWLSSDAARNITGQLLVIDGGVTIR